MTVPDDRAEKFSTPFGRDGGLCKDTKTSQAPFPFFSKLNVTRL